MFSIFFRSLSLFRSVALRSYFLGVTQSSLLSLFLCKVTQICMHTPINQNTTPAKSRRCCNVQICKIVTQLKTQFHWTKTSVLFVCARALVREPTINIYCSRVVKLDGYCFDLMNDTRENSIEE